MTDTFVPLVAGAAAPGGLAGPVRLKPVSPKSGAFEPANPVSAKSDPVILCEPEITLERQGETVTHIRVQCGCGQVIELKCEY